VSYPALVVLHVALIAAAGLLIARYRSERGSSRRQLRWIALAAVPFPVLIVGAFVAALLNSEVALGVFAGAFAAIVPIAALLAIERDQLYDVDRLLTRGLTYSLLTALLVICYVVVVVFVGESLGGVAGASEISAVVATLATVSVAAPLRRRLQDGLDRRFNRRRFEAVAAMRRYARETPPGVTAEQALRDALADPALRVSYWIEDRELWVGSDGKPATPVTPSVTATRHGHTVATVSYDESRGDRVTVEAAVAEARTELENERLRAAIALQLVEVRESRARIVAAQLAERRKLERNLHDGAQPRLLALALQLRAAELSGDPERARAALSAGVDDIQAAVAELRDLANGLHPGVLSDGGLAAALDDLVARTPVPVRLDVTSQRFSPALEASAWFIACEAVANAVKHARAGLIEIEACQRNGSLVLSIKDDGKGGADCAGRGLRGLADRAEAAGGNLTVTSVAQQGTTVTAELPCAS
jgi:signal transduction histidine kinase